MPDATRVVPSRQNGASLSTTPHPTDAPCNYYCHDAVHCIPTLAAQPYTAADVWHHTQSACTGLQVIAVRPATEPDPQQVITSPLDCYDPVTARHYAKANMPPDLSTYAAWLVWYAPLAAAEVPHE